MRSNPVKQSDIPVEPGVHHAPKKMTPREGFFFGVKLFAIVGAVVLLLWLADQAI